MHVMMVGGPRDGEKLLVNQPLPMELKVEHLGTMHTYKLSLLSDIPEFRFVWTQGEE